MERSDGKPVGRESREDVVLDVVDALSLNQRVEWERCEKLATPANRRALDNLRALARAFTGDEAAGEASPADGSATRAGAFWRRAALALIAVAAVEVGATLVLLPWAWGDYHRIHGELAVYQATKLVGHAAAAFLLLAAGRRGQALEKAFRADPIDTMLEDYRPLTTSDVLRFDVHWLGRGGEAGHIEPLQPTNRMRTRPLRILRGFLHRLDAGFNTPEGVEAGQETASHVARPGHGLVTVVTSGGGIVDGTGRVGGFAWKNALRRQDGSLRLSAKNRIYRCWGLTSESTPFWDGPSGPFAWLTPNDRFVLADLDGWGCRVLVDAMWHD